MYGNANYKNIISDLPDVCFPAIKQPLYDCLKRKLDAQLHTSQKCFNYKLTMHDYALFMGIIFSGLCVRSFVRLCCFRLNFVGEVVFDEVEVQST